MLKDIYFLNTQALTEELKSGTFTEIRALKHLIISTIIGRFSFEFPVVIEFSESEISIWRNIFGILLFIVSGFITYYGLWLTYQANQKGDGKDFFLRLTSLILPIGFKLVIYFLLIGLVLGFIATLLVSSLNTVGMVVSVTLLFVATVVFYSFFYIQLRKNIAIISGHENV